MKLNKLFYGTLAAMTLVGCSDNISESTDRAFDDEGNAYVKFSINLPTIPGGASSRAIGDYGDGYGEFNDGNPHEYAVENAILCVFDGTGKQSELDYVLQGAYLLGSGEWNKENDATQITNSRTFVQKITDGGAQSADNLYAYVILNRHDFFYFSEAKESLGHLMFHSGRVGEPDVDLHNQPMRALANVELKESGRRYDANALLMTNMPYATKAGGTKNPTGMEMHTLYPLKDALYATQAEAEKANSKSAEINVERVLAKVETTLKDGVNKTDFNNYRFKFLGWYIDNTNPNTYVGRRYIDITDGRNNILYNELKHPTLNTHRFVSEYPVSTNPASDNYNRYRTFWAIDANYDKNAWDPEKNPLGVLINEGGDVIDYRLMEYNAKGENIGGRLRPSGSYYYCTENTFNVRHQSVSNTTRVVVAAQFVDDDNNPKPFFTIDSESDKMYTETEVQNYVKARIVSRVSFMEWVEDYLSSAVTDASAFIKVNIDKPMDGGELSAGRCTLSIKNLTEADITSAQVKAGKTVAQAIDAFNLAVNNTVAKDGKMGHNEYIASNILSDFYKEGVSYYAALIKHFGENETPWSSTAHSGKPNNTNDIYDNYDESQYLGRYGVVRNNWYKIEITGIRQIGSAVVPVIPGLDPLNPENPDTPDDTVESYLKIKVNIMPWALRLQETKL